MDAYSLVLAGEAVVVAASGLVIAFTAFRHSGVVLYSGPLALVGSGLAVAGAATLLFAVGSATQLVAPSLVVLVAVPYCLAGWHIATDALVGDDHDVFVAGTNEKFVNGFEEEQ